MRKVELLPTRDGEAGYGPGADKLFAQYTRVQGVGLNQVHPTLEDFVVCHYHVTKGHYFVHLEGDDDPK